MRKKPAHRHAVLVLLGLTFFLTLPGCAILARQQKENRIDPEALSRVKKGISKAEVTDLLGAPQEIIFSNKEHDPLREHAYVYEHETTHYTGVSLVIVNFGNMSKKKDRVVVFFDEQGKVEHVGTSLNAKDSGFDFPFGQ